MGAVRRLTPGRRLRLATVLGCLAAVLLVQQVGGVLHELSHLRSDPHHAPGKSLAVEACAVCGAFATLASPLGTPPALLRSASPDVPVLALRTIPAPHLREATVHNRGPPSVAFLMTA
jgi:hypothetical protein